MPAWCSLLLGQWCQSHLSIWSRWPLRKEGHSIERSWRWCSLRNREVNWTTCCSCSSKADTRMGERMSLCTLCIWPRRGANRLRVDSCQMQFTCTSWRLSAAAAAAKSLQSCLDSHQMQKLHKVFDGDWINHQLLTAQVYRIFSICYPPDDVGEEFTHGPFLETKFYEHLQGSQGYSFPYTVLRLWCHQWAWGPTDHVSRSHAPEVLASIP